MNITDIPVSSIDPSPYQPRRYFDETKLVELGQTIKDEGLMQAIVVRKANGDGRHELIAGERRWRAAKLAKLPEIASRIVDVDDATARKMSLWENIHREDLTKAEEAIAVVSWLDANLAGDAFYDEGGETALRKVRMALGKMHGDVRHDTDKVANKFIGKVERLFKQLRKPIEWHAFYNNDLPLVEALDTDKNLAEVAVKHKLSKDQIRALTQVKKQDPEAYEEILEKEEIEVGFLGEKVSIADASSREIRKTVQAGGLLRDSTSGHSVRNTATRSPRLIVGDAAELPLPDGYVDLIITSPPYNIGPKKGKRESRKGGRSTKGGRAWGGIVGETLADEDEYQQWQVACLDEMFRIAKQGASCFYNHKVRQHDGSVIHPITWLSKSKWTIRQEIIWDRMSTHNHEKTYFWPHDERVYWLTKGKPKIASVPINESTVWTFHGPVAGTWHNSPFSETLVARCLSPFATKKLIVLDPFGGSMTTCRVALQAGVAEAIGVDIDESTVKRAAKENNWKLQ